MSAELLRRAAAELRGNTEAATPGPWDEADDGLVWANRLGDPVSGSVLQEDADYIALMHPPVALALAVWLDAAAYRMPRDGWTDTAAMSVARAILREES